jgi:hypothetical protein
MMIRPLLPLVLLVLMCWPALALAQGANPGGSETSFLGGFVGVASAEPAESLTAGAAAGWRISPWVTAEGRMSWIDRPSGQQMFTGGFSALLTFPVEGRARPFVRGGFGLYSASFRVPADMSTVPAFYQPRLVGDPGGGFRTFNDPAVITGVGVKMISGRSFSWRPEVETFLVFRESRTFFVATASVQFSFHFEAQTPNPSRKPSR